MNKRIKYIIIISVVILLILGIYLGITFAYYTGFASGLSDFPAVDITVNVSMSTRSANNMKYVSINNTGTYPVYVRIKTFASSLYNITYNNLTTSGWTSNVDGYIYYNNPISSNTPTNELAVSLPSTTPSNGASSNLVIIYEYSKARYTEAGVPYADWTQYNITS